MPTPANLEQAQKLNARIKAPIEAGTLVFSDVFPKFRGLKALPPAVCAETCGEVFDEFILGEAVHYSLRHWDALYRYTEVGYVEASNNFSERCMRTIAEGRKAFLFVGSERAGHAAAIYYSIVESCRVNNVNPLSYVTYALQNVRNNSIHPMTPDEYSSGDLRSID
jgi:hypothetical protein